MRHPIFFWFFLPLFALQASHESLAPLVKPLLKTVVSISSTAKVAQKRSPADDIMREFFGDLLPHKGQPSLRERTSLGSGFIVDTAGYIVTNYHVIKEAHNNAATEKSTVTVTTHDQKEFKACIVGVDEATDVALLKITPKSSLTAITWGYNPQVGDKVVAIGNPFGLEGTLTSGIVSNISRNLGVRLGLSQVPVVLQTDASINSGNSGGPIFDMQGRVIAMATFIMSPSGGSIGLNFAVPSDIVQPVVEQLKQWGRVRRGWLGIQFQEVDKDMADSVGLKDTEGAFVHKVLPQSPAHRSGILKGDIILSIDGTSLSQPHKFPYIIGSYKKGKKVSLLVWRYITAKKTYEKRTLSVVIEEAVQPKQEAATPGRTLLGMSLREMTLTGDQARTLHVAPDRSYVKIESLDESYPWQKKNILPGDIILSVSEENISKTYHMERLVTEAKRRGRKSILLWILRTEGKMAGETFAVTLSLLP